VKAKGTVALRLLVIMVILLGAGIVPSTESLAAPATDPAIEGPYIGEAVTPYVFNGDLRDLPQIHTTEPLPHEIPLLPIPGQKFPPASGLVTDSVAQTWQGLGHMPEPIANFPGLEGSEAGYYVPPDTNGDVGLTHYVQTVNVGIGMYDKATGAELVNIRFNDFFNGTGTLCDYSNRGDPVALYDPLAGRWLITDFGWVGNTGPYYECIAVSQSEDPVSGGWYFYALLANPGDPNSLNDYPKLGVWPDAYYMSANMFYGATTGARVWALDRAAMLNGDPMNWVAFDLGASYWSLLPANLRGAPPPAGSPNYFASAGFPNTLRLWEFHVDWANPGNSSFTGPTDVPIADFSVMPDIPQPPPGEMVDSLSPRLMMQLQYRNFGSHESLWMNHTVSSDGVAGVRWYEVRDPGGIPTLYQQGTYQPDENHRWMGSLAVDQDGNMAVGYSTSSESLYPAIRYAGRLADEVLGTLPQGEASLIEGSGVQLSGSGRWGDYSAMSVDPEDDCTFWYTQEYYEVSSDRNWQTRIGSFRFPSCGLPKGSLAGNVYDAETMEGLAGVSVTVEGLTNTVTAETDGNGHFTTALPGGTYTVTAGPLQFGYPDPVVIPDVAVAVGLTTTVDIPLVPEPYLAEDSAWIDDDVAGGNGNGYPEPGEAGVLLWETISNTGATTATNVTAHLTALTPGVDITVSDASYPDVAVGETASNLNAFELSIAPTVTCGLGLDFQKTITADQGVYTIPLRIYTGIPLPPEPLFSDDMEAGPANWSTGGTYDRWEITEEQAHSPTHAWSDSPNGDYFNNTNAWLQSPTFDLSDRIGLSLSFWHRYALEIGYDFGYLEYSLNGGADWEVWDEYNGFQYAWTEESLDASVLEEQSNVAFRFRLYSDGGVTEDGWYIDDVDLLYQPFECTFPVEAPGTPTLLAPPDGTITTTHAITLMWEAGLGETPDAYNLELDGAVFTTTDTMSDTTLLPGLHSWRVRGFNAAGYSDYTDAWTVEIIDLPGVPTLLSPPDETITAAHNITFTWEAGPGSTPDGYNLELDGTVVTTTGTTSAAFLEAGNHSWRVRAFNAAGYSDYTGAWALGVNQRIYLPLIVRNH
jgi:hypothetical protein